MSELDRNTSWRMWLIAAVCAVTLHVGGIAAAVYEMQQEEDADGLGANVSAIGVEMVSPDVEESDMAPGIDQDESSASTAMQEQKAVEKESDLPVEKPQEDENADRTVTENKAQKPDEETPDKAQKKQEASDESAAAQASRRQKLEDAKTGEIAKAPEVGISAEKKKLTAKWQKQISAILDKNKVRPDVEKLKKLVVTISFSIDRAGKIVSTDIVTGSGDPVYDDAAVSTLHRIKKFPAPPPELADDTLSYKVDIKFDDKRKTG